MLGRMEPVPDGLSNISPLAKRMRCSSVTFAVAVMTAYRLSSMSPLARIPRLQIKNRWHSVRARFGSYPDCVEACITCSPAIGICPHLQCGIGKHHNAAVENHKIRRTGTPGRDAPGRCRKVPRRNRLRTRRGWRWLAAVRWKGRSGRPSASLPESERYQ